jgi:hypothetical protein
MIKKHSLNLESQEQESEREQLDSKIKLLDDVEQILTQQKLEK